MFVREGVNFGGKELSIETGRMAKQADGAVVVRYGDTMVLVTAVASSTIRPGVDFMPLTVDYLEKTSAAGRLIESDVNARSTAGLEWPRARTCTATGRPVAASTATFTESTREVGDFGRKVRPYAGRPATYSGARTDTAVDGVTAANSRCANWLTVLPMRASWNWPETLLLPGGSRSPGLPVVPLDR